MSVDPPGELITPQAAADGRPLLGPPVSALADDPQYRAAVVDLLGVLAAGELLAFERLASDGPLAPLMADRAALGHMAVAELRHYDQLVERLKTLGADPETATAPFVAPLEAFHAHTAPSDWLEGLVKAYVGDSIGVDFYREISRFVDAETRALVLEVCADTGHSAFVIERVRAAIAEDPRIAGRLALWGRRLVGEMLSQAQRVAAERDALSMLLVGGPGSVMPGTDLAEIGRMFARLTEAHSKRMSELGLAA